MNEWEKIMMLEQKVDELKQERVKLDSMDDEKMEKSFSREDKSTLSDEEILEKLNKIRNKCQSLIFYRCESFESVIVE